MAVDEEGGTGNYREVDAKGDQASDDEDEEGLIDAYE